MANGDVFRLSVEGHYALESITVNNVLWFQQVSAAPLANEAQLLADDFKNNIIGGIGQAPRNCQSPDFVYDLIRVQRMLFTYDAPVSSAFGPPVQVGSALDDPRFPIPTVCCLVYKLSTGVAGRRHRGRLFLGGFGCQAAGNTINPMSDRARWSAAFMVAMNAYMQRIKDRYNGTTIIDAPSGYKARWGIYSHAIGGSSPPFNVSGFQNISSFSTDGIVRVQRRREYGRGV